MEAQLDQSAAEYVSGDAEVWPKPKAGDGGAEARENKSRATAKGTSPRLLRLVTDRSSLAEDAGLDYKTSGKLVRELKLRYEIVVSEGFS